MVFGLNIEIGTLTSSVILSSAIHDVSLWDTNKSLLNKYRFRIFNNQISNVPGIKPALNEAGVFIFLFFAHHRDRVLFKAK